MTKYVAVPSPNGTNFEQLYIKDPAMAYDGKNGRADFTIYKRKRPLGHNLARDEVDEDLARKMSILKAIAQFCDEEEVEAVRRALLGDDDGEAEAQDDEMTDEDRREGERARGAKAMDKYTVSGRDLDAMSANMGPRGGEMPVRGERVAEDDGSFYRMFPEAALHRPKIDNAGLQPRSDRQSRRPLRGIEARPRMANDAPSSASVSSFYELFPDAKRLKQI